MALAKTSLVFNLARKRFGVAMVASSVMIVITIMISTSVKPQLLVFLLINILLAVNVYKNDFLNRLRYNYTNKI